MLKIQKRQPQEEENRKTPQGLEFPPSDPEEEEEFEVEEPIPNENNQVETQETSPQGPMESQPEKISDTMENSGTKRLHTSDTSHSDKENPEQALKIHFNLLPRYRLKGSAQGREEKGEENMISPHIDISVLPVWNTCLFFDFYTSTY